MKDLENESDSKGLLTAAAWFTVLAISDLPLILFQSIASASPPWLMWAKAVYLLFFLGACLLWRRLRPLLAYAIIMLVFLAAISASKQALAAPWLERLSNSRTDSFAARQLTPFIPDTGIALVVLLSLWAIHRLRERFFLVTGDTRAPIEPVRWLGIGKGESWKIFGWIFTLAATLLVAIPTVLGMSLAENLWLRLLPLLPVVLLLSALNAFNEEIYYRTTLLSTLPQVIGRQHALLINAALFGLAHYYGGSPPGVPGVLMTGFLGWLLGKAMLETKGFVWSWFMHFLPDVIIFSSYAMAWLEN